MTDSRILTLLEKETLKNIVILKLLRQFPQMKVRSCFKDDKHALLLVLPTQESSFYSQLYPWSDHVLFPVVTDMSLLKPLLEPYFEEKVMFAIADSNIATAISATTPLTKLRSYISYTGDTLTDKINTDTVKLSHTFSPECSELFKANNYSQQELDTFASWGGKTFSITTEDGIIASACFIFPNFGDIWEIAGVHTLDSQRRRGFAKQIILKAAAYILSQDKIIRYQTEDKNLVSQKLAESIGLHKFLELSHYAAKIHTNQDKYIHELRNLK